MGGCFTWLLLLVGAVAVMVSLLRWFEQTADAVDHGWWNRLALLLVFPPAVWFYPSRIAAGRPIPASRHEPVRGLGGLPTGGLDPVVPAKTKPHVGADRIARLREQLRQQGMLNNDSSEPSNS